MIREIITPKSENYYVNIPKEYINKKIEILVLPFETPMENTKETTGQDILSKRYTFYKKSRSIEIAK